MLCERSVQSAIRTQIWGLFTDGSGLQGMQKRVMLRRQQRYYLCLCWFMKDSWDVNSWNRRLFKSTLKDILNIGLSTRVDQNMPPPNRPLWHKELFWAEVIKQQKELSALILCLKAGHKFPSGNVFPPPLSHITRKKNPYHSTGTVSTEMSLHKQILLKYNPFIYFFHVFTFS